MREIEEIERLSRVFADAKAEAECDAPWQNSQHALENSRSDSDTTDPHTASRTVDTSK
jgi:hypothetical protein